MRSVLRYLLQKRVARSSAVCCQGQFFKISTIPPPPAGCLFSKATVTFLPSPHTPSLLPHPLHHILKHIPNPNQHVEPLPSLHRQTHPLLPHLSECVRLRSQHPLEHRLHRDILRMLCRAAHPGFSVQGQGLLLASRSGVLHRNRWYILPRISQ
jgi:hypothetical protein